MSNYGITVDTGGPSSVAGMDLAAFYRNTGLVHSALEGMKASVRAFGAGVNRAVQGFARLNDYARGIVSALMHAQNLASGLESGLMNLYRYGRAAWKELASSLDSMATSALYLRNSLAAMAAPLINALAPVIDYVTDKLVGLFNLINQLLARLTGSSTYVAAKKTADAWDSVSGRISKATAALRRYISGFDHLNVLTDGSAGSDSGGGGGGSGTAGMFEERQIESGLAAFADSLKAAFEASDWMALGTLIGGKINEMVESVDWAGLGAKVGFYVNGLFSTAYWTLETVNFTNIGASVAEFLNNALAEIDFTTVGATIALLFTSLAETIAGFVDEFDWVQFAEKLADGVNGFTAKLGEKLDAIDWAGLALKLTEGLNAFIARTDWASAGQTLGGRVNDLLAVLGTAAAGFDWKGAGDALVTAVNNLFKKVDWEGLGTWLNDTLQGVLDFGIAFLQGFDAVGFANNVSKALAKVDWDAVAAKLWELFKLALQKLGEFVGTLLFGGSADVKLNLGLLRDGWNTVAQWLGIEDPMSVLVSLIRNGWTSIGDFVGTVVDVFAKLSSRPAEGSSTLPGVFGGFFETLAKLTGKTGDSLGLKNVYGSYFETLSKLTGATEKSLTTTDVYGAFFKTESELTGRVKGTQGTVGVYGSFFETLVKLTGMTDKSLGLVPEGERKGVFASAFSVLVGLTGKTGDSKDLTPSSKRKGVFASFFTVLSKLTGKDKSSKTLNGVFGDTFTVKATLSSTINGLSDFVSTVAGKLKDALENIWKKITSSGAATGGVITNGDRLRPFARGGVITHGGMANYLSNVPHYAGGTARAHGTVFVAGEAGPEIMGHINGRTEILNKSQLAATMYSAVVAGMSQAVSALGTFLSGQLANCTNAIVGTLGNLAAVANIRYHEPVMASGTVLPYDVAAQVARTGMDLQNTLDANNEDLIQTIISVIGAQTSAIVSALRTNQQQQGTVNNGLTAQQLIDDINRRAQMFGSSPLLD